MEKSFLKPDRDEVPLSLAKRQFRRNAGQDIERVNQDRPKQGYLKAKSFAEAKRVDLSNQEVGVAHSAGSAQNFLAELEDGGVHSAAARLGVRAETSPQKDRFNDPAKKVSILIRNFDCGIDAGTPKRLEVEQSARCVPVGEIDGRNERVEGFGEFKGFDPFFHNVGIRRFG